MTEFTRSTTAAAFWSPERKRLWSMLALGTFAILVWQGLSAWKTSHAILLNASDSLPNWAFVLETKAPPARADLIFFRAPAGPVMQRHFGAGEHMFGKHVIGGAGDVVTREGRTFFVNGKEVATAKIQSRFGEPLALGPVGKIPFGCYYVGTDHKDGFDSRYALIGWICRDRIVGTGKAIL